MLSRLPSIRYRASPVFPPPEGEAFSAEPQLLFQVAVADGAAPLHLPAGLGNRRQELGVAFSWIPLQIIVVKRHQERDRVPIAHHEDLFLLCLPHGGFPRGVLAPSHGLHRLFPLSRNE